ncbi:Na+/H+ antiporter [Paracoccus sp. (in: a-proteobacteria)]|uniref:Na+/H+ antiporter n=1 Tax=Paracoccus sp. TaxID=267 RepID=UPI00289DC662|nr:Na+/H+ antiporter [Paracoccus sp. (in: a-proteobacteria)]
MQAISTVLIMLVAVVASGVLVRVSALALPLPLVQIMLGAVLAGVTDLGVRLDPDMFFLLFLPPLLFLDGWRIPKEGLLRDRTTILQLAFGLVIFTVLGVGLFIHWMIPEMPLAVAFALAAILSPTDPVAVSSISARVPIPKRMMHILEGESLLNDASGLVCMRFAVAAAMTGAFSLAEASLTFIWLVVGGVLAGLGVSWGITTAKGWLSARYGEETGSEILISLIIPFSAYTLAEHLEASGILAAVAAGMFMSFSERSGQALATTRMRRTAVWDALQFTLNGVMFVLLGEQLPQIIASAVGATQEAGHHDPIWLLVYVLAITMALAALRFLWVWVSLRLTIFRAARKGEAALTPGWRLIAAVSLSGVRGAITLAGILTLPYVLADGSLFPARALAIFLAAGVIILSLLAASFCLPMLLRGITLPPEPRHQREEDLARRAAAEAAIRAVEAAQHHLSQRDDAAELYAPAAVRVMDLYRERLEALATDGESEAGDDHLMRQEIKRQFWLTGLRAERAEIFHLARHGNLPEETLLKLVREIDLLETRMDGSF